MMNAMKIMMQVLFMIWILWQVYMLGLAMPIGNSIMKNEWTLADEQTKCMIDLCGKDKLTTICALLGIIASTRIAFKMKKLNWMLDWDETNNHWYAYVDE